MQGSPIDWEKTISIFASITTLVSFIINIYQYHKVQSLKQTIDAIDRVARAALIESMELEKKATNGEEKYKTRVLTGMLVALLNVSTTFLSYKRENFKDATKSPPGMGLGE